MVMKLELKLPGTDVGMSIAFGHLDENSKGKKKEISSSPLSPPPPPPEPSSGAKVRIIKNDLEESECECDDCSGKSKIIEKATIHNEDDLHSVDMVTKIFTSLMQCTASNIHGSQLSQNAKLSQKTKGLKQFKASSAYTFGSESEDDPLARGILGKGCSSDFSVSQSLYPDDILVSYEPKRKKSPKSTKNAAKTSKPTPLSDNIQPATNNLKDVRIIPINKSTNAKILPNRKFKESKYDVSCISVPTFCNKAKLISCCTTRLVPQIPRCDISRPEDENLMISVPSAIYPDNIILTLKNAKTKKNKKK